MSDLTDKFTATNDLMTSIGDEAHSQRATIEATLEDIQSGIASINSDMLLMKSAILAAMGQTGACFPCPTPTIVVPSVPPDTVPINSEFCQRAQAFLATVHAILAAMDTLQSFNVIGTFNVLNDAISEVVTAIVSGGSTPLPSFPETVNIVGDYISYAGERLFSGVGLVEQFEPIEGDLRNALFAAGSASAAQSAYNSSIEASGVSNGAKLLFQAVAYNALYVFFFDPDSEPDLSGFDGSLCSLAHGTCFTIDLIPASWSNGSSVQVVAGDFGTFTGQTAITTSSGVVTSDEANFYDGDLTGWTWEVLIGSAFITSRTGNISSSGLFSDTGVQGVDGVPDTCPNPTGSFFIRGASGARVRLCFT